MHPCAMVNTEMKYTYGLQIARIRVFCDAFLGSELASIPDLLISVRTTNELLQAFFVYTFALFVFLA